MCHLPDKSTVQLRIASEHFWRETWWEPMTNLIFDVLPADIMTVLGISANMQFLPPMRDAWKPSGSPLSVREGVRPQRRRLPSPAHVWVFPLTLLEALPHWTHSWHPPTHAATRRAEPWSLLRPAASPPAFFWLFTRRGWVAPVWAARLGWWSTAMKDCHARETHDWKEEMQMLNFLYWHR